MPKPYHRTCEDWKSDEEHMTEADWKFRDLPHCANEGKHERCVECAANKRFGRGPSMRWGKCNFSSPL